MRSWPFDIEGLELSVQFLLAPGLPFFFLFQTADDNLTAHPNPSQNRFQLLGIEPVSVGPAVIHDDAAFATEVPAVHQFAAYRTGSVERATLFSGSRGVLATRIETDLYVR